MVEKNTVVTILVLAIVLFALWWFLLKQDTLILQSTEGTLVTVNGKNIPVVPSASNAIGCNPQTTGCTYKIPKLKKDDKLQIVVADITYGAFRGSYNGKPLAVQSAQGMVPLDMTNPSGIGKNLVGASCLPGNPTWQSTDPLGRYKGGVFQVLYTYDDLKGCRPKLFGIY